MTRIDEEWLREREREEKARDEALASKPCAEHAKAGRGAAAVAACEAIEAWRTCSEFSLTDDGYGPNFCARTGELGWRYTVEQALESAKVPRAIAEDVLGGIARYLRDGSRIIERPLTNNDPMRIARAWVSAKPVDVKLTDGALVKLTGREDLLILAGTVGVGKSVAAAQTIASTPRDRFRYGSRGLFISARKFTDIEAPLDEWCDLQGLLVVDDLGAEHAGATGFAIAQAQHLLEERLANRRRTVATTNLSRELFTARYGERLNDRLRASGLYAYFGSESLRGPRP